MRRHTSDPLLAIGGLAVAALMLPRLNIAAAIGFVIGQDSTGVAALGAAELLIWGALLGGVVLVLARTRAHLHLRVTAGRLLVGVMLALGVAVLGVGVARHSSNAYSMCCGSISQARQQLANAP